MKLPALALALTCISPVLVAQVNTKKPISLPRLPPTTPQGTEGGFWRTDNNFDPILRLKNVLLKQSLQVTPSIYFADGAEYRLPTVTLAPAGIAQIDLRYAIDSAPANLQSHISTYGMAAINYQWSWPAVIATIQTTDEIASLTFVSSFRSDVRQVHVHPEAANAQLVRGTWWLPTPDSDGFLVFENASLNPRQVDVRISGNAGNQLAEQQITLPSHATSFLKFSSLFGAVRGSETMGGIDVRYTGPKYGVLIYGGIADETHGYSASPILMEDHLDPNRPTHAVTLSVPGLLLGNADPTMQFPTGTYFKPFVLLHNLSAHAMQVSFALTSQGASGQPQTASLNPVSLAPGQVMKYDVASQFNSSNPLPDGYGSLTASFQGRDGDLQIHAGSVDQSHSYVFEVPASQQVQTASRTLCFWSIEGDNDSMITVWNYKSTAQDLNLTLRYSGGQYVLPIHLAPRQAYNLDMLSLVRSRVPDAKGTLIPSNITSGSGTLASSGGEDKPIFIALASSVFNVRNATCGSTCYTCDGATQTYFQPSPLNVGVGGTQGAQFQITWNTGAVYTNPTGSAWTSGNTSVATVDSNGNVRGQSPGQTAISVVANFAPVYASICSADHAAGCPLEPLGGGGPGNVVSVSQSPNNINMSTGDTNLTIQVSVNPASASNAAGDAMNYSLFANPYSSSTANLSFNPPQIFTGSDTWAISAQAGTDSPSGIFGAYATVSGVSSTNYTTIIVPPQILIQMLYGEANGYSQGTMDALGSSVLNRFGSAHAYFAQSTNWQNALTCAQFNGVCNASGITNGAQPELAAAVDIFPGTVGDTVGGSSCFFSPTSADWPSIQQMISSATTTLTPVHFDPGCFAQSQRQYVYKLSVDSKGSGVPTFIFVRSRNSTDPAAVEIP